MGTVIGKLNFAFEDLWKKHRLLIILLICGLMFDTLSTIHFMTEDGIEFEFHPLVRHSAYLLGPVVGTILSAFVFKVITGIMLAMYLHDIRAIVLIAPAITSTAAGFINFFGWKIFTL